MPRHLNQVQQQQTVTPPQQHSPRSVSIFVYKTINSVYKSGRKILVRVCEVASVSTKKVKPFKMFNLYSTMNRRGGSADDSDQPKELETTGHDRFCQIRHSRYEIRDPQTFLLWRMFYLSLSLLISLFLCSLEFNRCITNVYDDGAKLKWHVFLFLLFLFCYSFLVPFNIRSAFRKKRKKNVRRAQSAAEFDQQTLTAAHKRSIFK